MTRWLAVAAALIALQACTIERNTPPATRRNETPVPPGSLLGLRTVIYRVPDVTLARDWYADVLDRQPYFDEAYYVGFDINGFELGIQPDSAAIRQEGGGVAYWGVPNADSAHVRQLGSGAQRRSDVEDVGGGVRIATVFDPFGNVLGVIENPNFRQGGRR
jgi:predicted enzyme related to lactoylglutathione lyase